MNAINKPECYVASPYGFAVSTKGFYIDVLLPLVRKYTTVIDPWEVNVDHILAAKPVEQPELWLDLGDHHYNTIAKRAKIVVAGLDQEPPDNGTVCEVAWAAAHNIPVIGYRSDIRSSGEEGLKYNLMLGAAIRRSGGVTVSSLAELEKELKSRTTNLV